MNESFKMDFIIVGAMKSGTTSLGFHLRRHPSVCIPRSEVHYFENERNFSLGMDWYKNQILKHQTDQTVVRGEKTTAYTYNPIVAQRIHGAFPDTKLVWILREPVARAYSNYIHAFRTGSVCGSFEEAIALEPERMKKSIYYGYMERSRYAKQVEKYLEFFPRHQMHFMLFEEFIQNTESELTKLFNFIGVTNDGFILKDEPRGRAVMPRYQKSVYRTRQLTGPGLLWKTIQLANTTLKKPGYPKLDPAFKGELKKRFTGDNARLAELTGLDLSLWD